MIGVGYQVTVWLMALSSALMAGTYLAFSMVIMRALARLPEPAGMAAMNQINETILKTAFMPLFFGSTALALGMITAGLLHLGDDQAMRYIAAGSVYVVGMFVVTAAANVPLNNALASADGSDRAEEVWQRYLVQWTRWNSLRTIACLVTLSVCLTLT